MTLPDTLPAVIAASWEADAAWSAELSRVFGRRACEARYLPEGRGEAGSILRCLSDRREAATAAYRLALSGERAARLSLKLEA